MMKNNVCKRGLIVCGLFVCLSGLYGCRDFLEPEEDITKRQEEATEKIVSQEILEESQEAQDAKKRQNTKEAEERYAFSTLTKEEQNLYAEIYETLIQNETDTPLSTLDTKQLEKVFQCVLSDHPEIFYVDGYTSIRHMRDGEIEALSFSGSYLYNREEIKDRQEKIEAYTEAILADAPVTIDEYEKVKYVYEYLIEHTEYRLGAPDHQNICSVFLSKESVCQGYAKATQYLLQKMGISCVLVTGTVKTGETHAWNLVRINGEYYYVDTTWGDASYVMQEKNAGYEGRLPTINYEYLCIPDKQLYKTHRTDDKIPMPVCDSMTANYYVREGAYFTGADVEKLRALFEKAYEKGNEYVTLKCADSQTYDAFMEELIYRQKVFDYMHVRDGTVAYTNNSEQLSLSFWL